MGRKTVLVDDLDGKELPESTQPLRLSVAGWTYDLYLSESNAGKLMEAISPFTENAELVQQAPRRTGAAPKASSADKEDQKNARAWAQSTNFKFKNAAGEEKTLGDRGRIPDAVMEAWKVAGSPVMGE